MLGVERATLFALIDVWAVATILCGDQFAIAWVVANGAGDVQSIHIDPSVVDPADVEFLQDLVLSGVQEAVTKGKEMAAAEMSKLTGGMGLPGM